MRFVKKPLQGKQVKLGNSLPTVRRDTIVSPLPALALPRLWSHATVSFSYWERKKFLSLSKDIVFVLNESDVSKNRQSEGLRT